MEDCFSGPKQQLRKCNNKFCWGGETCERKGKAEKRNQEGALLCGHRVGTCGLVSRSVFLSGSGGKAAASRGEVTPGGGEKHLEHATPSPISAPPRAGSRTTKVHCTWNGVVPW